MHADYVPHAVSMPTRAGPNLEYKPLNTGPDNRESTYDATYVGGDAGPTGPGGHWMRARDAKPSGPLEKATTHTVDYTPKALPAKRVVAPAKVPKAQPFLGSTVYGDEFVQKQAGPAKSARPEVAFHPAKPLEGISTSAADYDWKDAAAPERRHAPQVSS